MVNTLLGTKVGMTSSYDARGRRVGATIVSISPNYITQIKTKEGKDGYDSVQLGYKEKKSTKKPQIGHVKKAGLDMRVRFFREVEGDLTDLQPGQEINLGQVFSIGDSVKVSGISKGRGFAGGMKRHGFHGGPKTHGQSDRHRAPGSIGSGTTPGRVWKGKKMAGHMGVERVSYKNLEVVAVDKANNTLTIKGGIPGPSGSLVVIEKLGKIKGYTPPPEPEVEEEEPAGDSAQIAEQAQNEEGEEGTSDQTQEAQVPAESGQAEALVEEVNEDAAEEGKENG